MTPAREDEWISAQAALALLGMPPHSGARTICKRAHAGLVRARADRFVHGDGRVADDVDVPTGFWWAEGEAALHQDWAAGDFDTWIDRRFHLRAFGVRFRRSDIERAIPAQASARGTPKGRSMAAGKNVFIGHGRAPAWLLLKDFVKDRLGLSYDEFNRVSVAGVANTARLGAMLDAAAFAFVVLTAEDEHADGSVRARMNVIHEVGLFQGRLGFSKAIVLLEEGCEEFSNIQGLGQIRFPKSDISARFEEVRRVLEREGMLPPAQPG